MADVPPLEDVPDILKKLQVRADSAVKIEKKKEEQPVECKKSSPDKMPQQQSSSNFGGMKKGFLFGGSSSMPKEDSKKVKQKTASEISSKEGSSSSKESAEDIPYIKAQKSNPNLVLKEVQEAMADANVAYEFQDKLAQRLEAHSDVTDVLSDPAWIPILDEFQRDPERAMIKYKDNTKVKKTLQRLCDVLGDTFLHMEKSNKSEEEKLSEKLMEEPHVKEALTDPLVMQICTYMKQGANDKVHRCIQTATPDQKRHIQTLIDFGLFSFSM